VGSPAGVGEGAVLAGAASATDRRIRARNDVRRVSQDARGRAVGWPSPMCRSGTPIPCAGVRSDDWDVRRQERRPKPPGKRPVHRRQVSALRGHRNEAAAARGCCAPRGIHGTADASGCHVSTDRLQPGTSPRVLGRIWRRRRPHRDGPGWGITETRRRQSASLRNPVVWGSGWCAQVRGSTRSRFTLRAST
jgi:hypothetical protein